MKPTIYLAGGLFNAAERLHNLYLERELIALDYKVILPQREALKFQNPWGFDLRAVANDCSQSAASNSNLYVGSIDGADADAGTAVEYGLAIQTGRAVIYRTDFRTDLDNEVGFNGMFRLPGTALLYKPCYFTELDEVEGYYKELAKEIHQAIQEATNSR